MTLRRSIGWAGPAEPRVPLGSGPLVVALVCALGCGASCEGSAPAEHLGPPPPPVEARTGVDKAVATTGDVITYEVVVEHDARVDVEIPDPGDRIAGFRIIDLGTDAPVEVDGRVIERRWYSLRADLVGSYILPPVAMAYELPPGMAPPPGAVDAPAGAGATAPLMKEPPAPNEPPAPRAADVGGPAGPDGDGAAAPGAAGPAGAAESGKPVDEPKAPPADDVARDTTEREAVAVRIEGAGSPAPSDAPPVDAAQDAAAGAEDGDMAGDAKGATAGAEDGDMAGATKGAEAGDAEHDAGAPPAGDGTGKDSRGAKAVARTDGRRQLLTTSPIFVEVKSVLPQDGTATDIRGLKPLELIERPFPWLPVSAGGALVAVAAVAAFVVWRRRRRGIVIPETPPHDLAFSALSDLRSMDFDDPAAVRRYYFLISEVVRRYVEGRFGLNATDLTSEEIRARLPELRGLPGTSRQKLEGFLTSTDEVKFAGHEPTQDEIGATYEAALSFVEETVPPPEPPEGQPAPA